VATASRGVRGRMSIGEVLALLRPDFPDVSISKIRFLESEGLVEPERAASGYRKFSPTDLERLRYILSAQRDHYLPLKVIRAHLEAMARGMKPPTDAGGPARVPDSALSAAREADADAATAAAAPDVRISADELLANSGLSRQQLDELMAYGLLRPRAGTEYFDADALVVASAVAALAGYGLEPRHLRAYKSAADRQVGVIEQVVRPGARHGGDAARARAAQQVAELTALSIRLHAALVRRGLRESP
jgi:DNA-binding transcriptional MerR regulator